MARIPVCKVDIKHKVVLIEKYDAYACLECNIWLEDKCDDGDCIFCSNRPDNPKNIKYGLL